ncbi:MAG: polysaccharide biosynthesis/export family protein [Moraxellaceae bacterium]
MMATLVLSGCTAMSPGFKVGELPPSGLLTAANGLQLQVQPITVETLPAIMTAAIDPRVTELFSQTRAPMYQLHAGDVLHINLWAHPEITPPSTGLSNNIGFAIDQAGNITFPLVGTVRAQGKSLDQFSQDLRRRLATYLRNPDVQVKVLAYNGRKIFIDGEVRNAGQFAITDQPQTLYSALTSAGGALPTADINNISLTRQGRHYHLGLLTLKQQGYSPSQLYLQEGDSLHVYSKESRKIYLLGEAGTPNAFSLPEQGMSLANLLGEGRGLNPLSGNPARIYVIRDQPAQQLAQIYHLDLSSISSLALADRFKLQANDMVYIDATGLARWSRVINLLLPSATAVRTAQVIGTGN